MPSDRFDRAIARIDAVNATDPTRLEGPYAGRPKELVHAEMLTEWVVRLRPDASEALLLAARAHHIRRWEHPRSSYPEGRGGYLRWRTALHDVHADEAAAILKDCGYDEATIDRVRQLIHKRGLGSDTDVQALEDGLILVFLQTQFAALKDRLPDDTMVSVLAKTWRKMSPEGHKAALALSMTPGQRQLIERALAGT